jgi:hypothetical protein
LLLLIVSCNRGCGADEPEARTLATVDGTPITEAELQLALEETLGPKASEASSAARRKVLESLVATRAIALVARKELSAVDLAEIERKAESYRDDQLVRQYLDKHAPVPPVSDAMVEAYYREHLDQLGGHAVHSYELIASEHEAKGASRAALITALAKAERETDWRKVASDLTKAGHAVRYESGQLPAANVDQQVATVIEALESGQASKPFFVGERVHLARLLGAHDKSARPIAEVAPMIQRTLRSRLLQEAVKKAGDKAVQAAEIVHRSK